MKSYYFYLQYRGSDILILSEYVFAENEEDAARQFFNQFHVGIIHGKPDADPAEMFKSLVDAELLTKREADHLRKGKR